VSWRYVVKVKDVNGLAESSAGSFEVARSGKRGFVTIASNQRYLRYSDGSSFYGVGLWYNDQYHFSRRGNITPAVSLKSNSPAPTQRLLPVGAQKAISYQ